MALASPRTCRGRKRQRAPMKIPRGSAESPDPHVVEPRVVPRATERDQTDARLRAEVVVLARGAANPVTALLAGVRRDVAVAVGAALHHQPQPGRRRRRADSADAGAGAQGGRGRVPGTEL